MLDGQIALVTGASRGIGRAIASRLGQEGAVVIGTATSDAGAESIAKTFADEGVKGRGVVLDVSNPASVDTVIDNVKSNEGAIAILVNNAGITSDNLLLMMKADEWDNVLNTNLSSIYRTCKACLRGGMMKARYGRIINIASVVGVTGNPGQTNYAAAKAGMIGFTKSLAREIGRRGITVNTVAPGYIETDMTRAMTEEQRQRLTALIPLVRLGEPEDIASAVAFLVSPGAGYITGETLHVNGGMYMP